MISIRNMKASALLRLGFAALALGNVFRFTIAHSVHANNTTDFVSGTLMGIGFGILAIYLWQYGRFGRGKPESGCAS